jgi:L-amino acid N-acyltransferase YncA
MQVLSSASDDEEEAKFRALLAATTVSHGNKAAIELATDLGFVAEAAKVAAAKKCSDRVKVIVSDVQLLLKQ